MTYTSPGADGDLPITQAVDIGVIKVDNELRRLPNAENWQGKQYTRIDLAGSIIVTNRHNEPVEIELVRYALGNVTEAGNGGKIEKVNVFEDRSMGEWLPPWWGWYSWPSWWFRFNGVGKITWRTTLEVGKSIDLTYTWNYYSW